MSVVIVRSVETDLLVQTTLCFLKEINFEVSQVILLPLLFLSESVVTPTPRSRAKALKE